MNSRVAFAVTVAALLLMVGVTVVQGRWTDRWGEPHNQVLDQAARRLERCFPRACGDWAMDQELETSAAELERAGAVGSISRVYRSQRTKTPISAFVVCATPHDASGHTPDRCYPGAGFEIAEAEHRQMIPLRDGRVAEAFTGTFAKQGQTLRVFWTYGVPADKDKATDKNMDQEGAEAGQGGSPSLTWLAPQIARIALNDFPAVYKLYAIIDQTKLPGSRATSESIDFMAEVLPAFEAAIAAESPGSRAESQPADPQPADAQPADPQPPDVPTG